MRITELFTAQSIALDEAAADQAQIIDRLVELQATHGNITDREAYKKALYAREAEASTYVDNGITVPHARTACVPAPAWPPCVWPRPCSTTPRMTVRPTCCLPSLRRKTAACTLTCWPA